VRSAHTVIPVMQPTAGALVRTCQAGEAAVARLQLVMTLIERLDSDATAPESDTAPDPPQRPDELTSTRSHCHADMSQAVQPEYQAL
jgi:hypothetical protein